MGPDLGRNAENGDESDIEDDGLTSSSEVDSEDEFYDAEGDGEGMTTKQARRAFPPTTTGASALGVETTPLPAIVASPEPVIEALTPTTPTATAPPAEKRSGRLPRLLSGRGYRQSSKDGSTPTSIDTAATPNRSASGNGDYLSAKPVKESSSRSGSLTPGGTRMKRPKFKKTKTGGYALDVGHDIQGIVMLEIARAEDLPKVRNSA